jgi:uncharacterized membrane protein YccC
MTPEIIAGVKVFVGWWAAILLIYTIAIGVSDKEFEAEVALQGSTGLAFMIWLIWWGFW